MPRGTISFLFTDIVGSTASWERDPAAMSASLGLHDALLRQSIESSGGFVFKTVGDAFCAAFESAGAALAAALSSQASLSRASWPGMPLKVRMGVHSGEAELRDGDYFGRALNRASRLCASAAGGQILVSEAARALAAKALPPGVALADEGFRRLKDLPEPVRIYRVLSPGLLDERPPFAKASRMAGNLPVSRDRFFGREAELATLVRLVTPGCAVTLTGPGGLGKTRLALETARVVMADGAGNAYLDGAWFVALEHSTSREGAARAALAAFDSIEQPDIEPVDSVLDLLRERRVLLVLDNCEHIVDEAAALCEALLSSCPGLGILATSRERLGLRGERVVALAPLGTGRGDPAVELFMDRAAAADPGFSPDEDASRAVAEICARLDGLPLAIEIAAARMAGMSSRELLSRLEGAYPLSMPGARGSDERRRSLRGLFDWSWRLLSEDERSAFARLSLFTDDFALEDAEGLLGPDADAALESLVAKSLVSRRVVEGSSRFRLLETLRAYARERLGLSGLADAAEEAMASFLESRMDGLATRFYGPSWAEAVSLLSRLGPTVLDAIKSREKEGRPPRLSLTGKAALAFLCNHDYRRVIEACSSIAAQGDVPDGPGSTLVLSSLSLALMQARSDYDAAYDLANRALESAGSDPFLLGEAKHRLGMLAYFLSTPIGRGSRYAGRLGFEDGERLFEEAGRHYDEAGYGPGSVEALRGIGLCRMFMNDAEGAVRHLKEAVRRARAIGDVFHESRAMSTLANALMRGGRLPEGTEAASACADLAADIKDRESLYMSMYVLGSIARAEGRLGEAERIFDSLLESAKLSGEYRWIRTGFLNLIPVLGEEGKADEASARLEERMTFYLRKAGTIDIANAVFSVAAILHAMSRNTLAATCLGAATSEPLNPGTDPGDIGAERRLREALLAELGEEAFSERFHEGEEAGHSGVLRLALPCFPCLKAILP